MKKQTFFNLISGCALGVAMLFAVPSCKKDKDACDDVVCNTGGQCVDGTCVYANPCDGITCQNGGTCTDGLCTCPVGYEGTNCETEARAKYIGVWQTTNEACTLFSPGTYTIIIATNSSGIVNVIVSNIYYAGYSVLATINGNTITIPSQTVSLSTIQGSGTLNGNTLTLSYSFTAGSFTETCNNTVYTKQ